MSSGMLMEIDELSHSENASSDVVGILGKTLGHTTYWEMGVRAADHSVVKIQQLGAQYLALTNDGYLTKKAATDVDIATDVYTRSNLEVIIDHVFYVNSVGTIQSSDGATETNKHLVNAPTGVNFVVAAMGRLHAIVGNRVYSSSVQQRIVAAVAGEHDTMTTINLDSNKYLKAGNHIDIYDASGTTRKVEDLAVSTVIGTAQVSFATPQTLALGDIIVYHDGINTDTIMWATDEVSGEWYVVPGADGYPLGAVSHYGSLIVIKSQSLWRDLGPGKPINKICDIGTTAPNTFKTSGTTGVFTNTNGIYVLDGNDIKEVSQKIKKYIKGITASNVQYWAAGIDGSKYRVWIGDTTEEDVKDCELILDMNTSRFDINSGTAIRSYGNLVVSDVLGTYIGTTYGDVMKLNDGYVNLVSAISFLVKTKYDNLGYPDFIKQWNRVNFFTVPGCRFEVFYSVDGGEEVYLGEIKKNPQSFDLTSIQKGVEIQFIFRETSKDVFPGIYGYEIYGDYDDQA